MKRIILAVDSFKGTFSTTEIHERLCRQLGSFASKVAVVNIPMADGGEGTLDVIKHAKPDLETMHIQVKHPLDTSSAIDACYLKKAETAFIEMAQTTGLHRVKETLRNPLNTSSYGFGQLIQSAVSSGARTLYIGIGGSCTNDGGIGMLQALGAKFEGVDATRPLTGADLEAITQLDLTAVSHWLTKHRLKVYVMCDVNNPLTGQQGATYTYGRQKGATEAMLERLENGMCHFEHLLDRPDLTQSSGAGAAGGVGAALALGLGATLQSGANLLMDFCQFDTYVQSGTIIITGEGSVDAQSLRGKVPMAVLERAKKCNPSAKVYLLAGQLGTSWHVLNALGFSGYAVCSETGTVASSQANLEAELDQAIQALIQQLPL